MTGVGHECGEHGTPLRPSSRARRSDSANKDRSRSQSGGLAHGADLHPTWLSHIEAGRNPSWGTVRRIAAALGVEVSDLARLAEEIAKS